jgi:hypothetical protein
VWNLTVRPAALETTTLSIRQVRPFHVGGKRIDTDAGPAELFEGLGIRADRAVTGADVEEESSRDARKHPADHPLVLADLGGVGDAANRFARRHPQNL